MNFDELKKMIRMMDNDKAIEEIGKYIDEHPEADEAYTLRGIKKWGCSDRAGAIEDYLTAIRINPQSKASEALRAVNEILDYRNKDLYNP